MFLAKSWRRASPSGVYGSTLSGGSTIPLGGRGFGAYLGSRRVAGTPPGPAVTCPCPNPWGSANTPKGLSAVSAGLASLRPPPTFTQVPRISGVPSGSRLIVPGFDGAFLACAFGSFVDVPDD